MRLRRARRRLRRDEGYTLVEMLTVLVIMGVVMASLTTVFVSASNAELDQNNRFQSRPRAGARARSR
jgi:prepilin-type N-terminal cleavage/methylation domain-containing protein